MSGKRRARVDVVEDPQLTHWLARTPDAPEPKPRRGRKIAAGAEPVATTTLVYSLAGGPYTDDGLRHTRRVELALAGCSDAEGAAIMGHGSSSSFVQYRRQAERIRLSENADA